MFFFSVKDPQQCKIEWKSSNRKKGHIYVGAANINMAGEKIPRQKEVCNLWDDLNKRLNQ